MVGSRAAPLKLQSEGNVLSKTITAEIEVLDGNVANGTIIAQGGRFGGWGLYVHDGVPTYDYNFLGIERFTVAAQQKTQTRQVHDPLRVPLRRWRAGQRRHGCDVHRR
jgi:hypothetical protein